MSQDNMVYFSDGNEHIFSDCDCFGRLATSENPVYWAKNGFKLEEGTVITHFGFRPSDEGDFRDGISDVVEAARELAGIADESLAFLADDGSVRMSANIPADQAMCFGFMVRNFDQNYDELPRTLKAKLSESDLTLKEKVLLMNIGYFHQPFNSEGYQDILFSLCQGLGEDYILSSHFLSCEQLGNILSDETDRGFTQDSFNEQEGYMRDMAYDRVRDLDSYPVSVVFGADCLEEFIGDNFGATNGMIANSMYKVGLGETPFFVEGKQSYTVPELSGMLRSLT